MMGGDWFVFHLVFWFVMSSLWILTLLFLERLTGNSPGAYYWLKIRSKNFSLLRLDFLDTPCAVKNFRPNFLLQLCQGLRDTDRCHWPWPASPGAPTLTPGRWPEDLFNLQLFAWPALGFSWILALLYFLAVAWCLLEALWELLSPGFARGISLCCGHL